MFLKKAKFSRRIRVTRQREFGVNSLSFLLFFFICKYWHRSTEYIAFSPKKEIEQRKAKEGI